MEASKTATAVSKNTLEDLTYVGKSTFGDFTKSAKEVAAKKGLLKVMMVLAFTDKHWWVTQCFGVDTLMCPSQLISAYFTSCKIHKYFIIFYSFVEFNIFKTNNYLFFFYTR